jgi:hypothetical protein
LGKTKLQTFVSFFSILFSFLFLNKNQSAILKTPLISCKPTDKKPSTASHFPSLLQASIPLQFLLTTPYIKSDDNGTNSASFEPQSKQKEQYRHFHTKGHQPDIQEHRTPH